MGGVVQMLLLLSYFSLPPLYIICICGYDTQQKQIGCFNHREVTLVADKLKRQWLCIVYFANCMRQPERKLPRPSTTLSCTYSNHQSCIFERGHTCMYIKEHTIISCRYSNLCERITTKSSYFFVVTHSCSVLRIVSCKV